MLRNPLVIGWIFGWTAAMTANVWIDVAWWASFAIVCGFGLTAGTVSGLWGRSSA